MIFVRRLYFISHIESITLSALKSLGFIIRKSRSFRNESPLRTLYYSCGPNLNTYQLSGTLYSRFIKML
nr:unnamed protein product [Callosobruchus chinensis]